MLLIAGLAFFLNLFPGTVLQLAHARIGLVVSQMLFIAGPVALAIRWFFLDPRSIVPMPRPDGRAWAAAVLGTLGLNHLLTLYGAWQERVFPTPEPLRSLFDDLLVYRGAFDLALLLVVFALVPAACEEILFRGFLQSGLARLVDGPAATVVASALVFGLFHFDPWRFAGVAGLGLYLAYLRQATGGLGASMAAHATNNIVSISLAVSGVLAHDRAPGNAWSAMAAAALVVLSVLLIESCRTAGKAPGRML